MQQGDSDVDLVGVLGFFLNRFHVYGAPSYLKLDEFYLFLAGISTWEPMKDLLLSAFSMWHLQSKILST